MDNAPVFPAARTWKPLLDLALAEDIGLGDVTTALVVPPSQVGTAVLEAREPLVLCGMEVACAVFREVDPALSLDRRSQDGERAAAGAALLGVSGPLSGILMAERTALNFLARMSGVATHTRRFVDAVAGTEARIYDTRKTLPGWRALDKYATAVGGATNHRAGLFDGILLKDNHIAAAGGTELAVKAALSRASAGLRVQVEVECYRDAEIAIGAGADFLLLDNIPIEEMHRFGPGTRHLYLRGTIAVEGAVDFARQLAFNVRDLVFGLDGRRAQIADELLAQPIASCPCGVSELVNRLVSRLVNQSCHVGSPRAASSAA